jgi:outer membrane receptor for ferrienterochelin and colicins
MAAFIKTSLYIFALLVFIDCGHSESRDLTQLSFEELSEVKITSVSKRAETVANSPAAVTVISSDEIRRFGFRTLSEALATVPGFVVRNDRNYEYVGIRGFSSTGDFDTRVLVLVNGHRINDVNYNYAGVGYDFPVDMESIDRIEVVKGPGSAMWGTSALLSVVNVITKSGESLSGKRATIETGSNRRIRGLAEYGERTSDGLDIYSSISGFGTHGEDSVRLPGVLDSNGLPANSINNDSENAYRALLTAKYKEFSLMFNANSRKKNVPIPPDLTPHMVDEDIFNTYDYSNRFELRYDSALDSKIGDLLTARFYSDYNSFNGEYPYSDESGTGRVLNFDNARSTRYGSELVYRRPIFYLVT